MQDCFALMHPTAKLEQHTVGVMPYTVSEIGCLVKRHGASKSIHDHYFDDMKQRMSRKMPSFTNTRRDQLRLARGSAIWRHVLISWHVILQVCVAVGFTRQHGFLCIPRILLRDVFGVHQMLDDLHFYRGPVAFEDLPVVSTFLVFVRSTRNTSVCSCQL